jgi:WD domain, G-beta repeat.
LDWAKTHSRIASGGKDQKVLIWDIEDYQTSLSSNLILFNKRELNAINSTEKFTNVKIQPKREFLGHTDAVEDVCFHPKNREVLISVSDDKRVICWDTRSDVPSYEVSMLLLCLKSRFKDFIQMISTLWTGTYLMRTLS